MYDYALVHVVYTIPIAIALTVVLQPLCTRLDVYKICFLLLVAVSYTIPWDSYLIKAGIWTYPPDSIVGPTFVGIPAEELFFFVIQTYITTCLHILLNKPVLIATYLRNETEEVDDDLVRMKARKRMGQMFLIGCCVLPFLANKDSPEGTYMRLISLWAAPVLLVLWTLAYQLIYGLPRSKTWLPIWIPTLYLWIVDTLALRRGTWSIASGTKLGIHVWPHLEIEEAVFFLVTNTLVVWGSCAFDSAIAILDAFPEHFPTPSRTPSPVLMLKAVFLPTSAYNTTRLQGLRKALTVLAKKSRSFYLASGVFSGRLRIDLVLLYAFCRVADDLIDNAPNAQDAEKWIKHFSRFLDVAYSQKKNSEKLLEDALTPFPPDAQAILALLPVDRLPSKPLYSLLDGFRIDLQFLGGDSEKQPPIRTFDNLERYASCVAATIGELCLSLVYYHDPDASKTNQAEKEACIAAGKNMGRALQYVNIVRDVHTDAAVGRCYIPDEWLNKTTVNSSPEALKAEILQHRKTILDLAFQMYAENRDAIERIPPYARDGVRVAVESYMEIGRVMRERMQLNIPLDFSGGGKGGKASVPRSRRVLVGWRTMSGWRGST